jgi:hypothetical protein
MTVTIDHSVGLTDLRNKHGSTGHCVYPPFTTVEMRCSLQSLALSGKPFSALSTSTNSVPSLCTNCRAVGSSCSIILATYTGILITCLLSGFKYAFKYATKGFIGRFEDNRDLWGEAHSPLREILRFFEKPH